MNHTEYMRKWRNDNRERYREIIRKSLRKNRRKYRDASVARSRQWRKDNPHRVNEWRLRNPFKRRAHRAVQKALASGKLVRPLHCSGCGVECKPQGHHPDYSRLLAVVWLCRSCHMKVHYPEASMGEDKMKTQADSVSVANSVCLRQGHHINLFVAPDSSVYLCIQCGLTKDEIKAGSIDAPVVAEKAATA